MSIASNAFLPKYLFPAKVLDELNTANGFDLLKPETLPTPTWDDVTRTMTVSVTAGSTDYSFYANGNKLTLAASQSIQVPDVSGTYYIYFDNDGIIGYDDNATLDPDVFYQYAIVALVYWNATQQKGIMGWERHGYRMSARTHHMNHSTTHARYESGFSIVGLVDGQSTFSQINSGFFWDEDIRHTIPMQSTFETLYRLGVDGEWTVAAATNEVGFIETGDTYYSYNYFDGTTWTLREGAYDTDFYITFFISTGDHQDGAIKRLLGQNAYASVSQARAAILTEKDKLTLEGLPSPEYIFIGAIITKRTGKVKVLDDGSLYLDLTGIQGGGGSSSTAASLAADVATSTVNFNSLLSSLDTNVQLALDTLDGHLHAEYVDLVSDERINGHKTFIRDITLEEGTFLKWSGGAGSAIREDFENDEGFGSSVMLHKSNSHHFLGITGDYNGVYCSFLSKPGYFTLSQGGLTFYSPTGEIVIEPPTLTGEYSQSLQSKNGIIALTSDISDALTSYVTLDTAQTITGAKTFTGDFLYKGSTDSWLYDIQFIDGNATFYGDVSFAFGTVGFSEPVSMEYLTIAQQITAPSFVKVGGTSAQFLKADGSVDTSSYLTITGKAADSDKLDGYHATYFTDYSDLKQEELKSAGEQLIINGTGALGDNTNFSLFTYKGDASPPGFAGSFYMQSGATGRSNDFLLPIDPNASYILKTWIKGGTEVSNYYIAIYCHDIDGNGITPSHTMFNPGSLNELSVELKDGDTTITLVNNMDEASWNAWGSASYRRKIIFWDYANSYGYTYPEETYSRHNSGADTWLSSADLNGNVITLSAPWSLGTVPAGTKLSQSSDGGTYKYIAAVNVPTTTSWVEQTGTIGGIDYSGYSVTDMFHPGTANVKVFYLLNRDATTSAETWIGGISFKSDYTSITSITGSKSEFNESLTDGNFLFVGDKATDSDLLDGLHASSFYLATNPSGYTSNAGTITGVSGGNGISASGSPVVSIALSTLTANWNGGTTYTITANDFIIGSDRSLKENIKELAPQGLDVNYVEFNYKTDKERRRAGVIAQDIEELYPDLVTTSEEGIKHVSYIDLLIREVAALKAEVKALRNNKLYN